MQARAYPDNGLFADVSTRTLQSVSLGENAGKINTGVGNAFVGCEAGKNNGYGAHNTFVGYQAGMDSSDTASATLVGAFAGARQQRGSNVTFVGFCAGEQSLDGNDLVGVGAYALRENQRGNGTVAVGYRAAERTLDGFYNTMIGTESGQDNRSGNFNTMAGYRSGRSAFLGNENTYFGAYSGYSNERGDGNTFVGYRSGESVTDGSFNVALGIASLLSATSGSCNVAIGPFAGANSTGNATESVLIGARVGENAAPQRSVLLGAEAGKQMQGSDSVIIGYQTAASLEDGGYNVIIGAGADTYQSNTHTSVAIGSIDTITAAYSVSVGNRVFNRGQYSVLLGYDLNSDTDNSVVIGNRNVLESVVLFKDPISEPLKNAVTSDGFQKIGLSNVNYSQTTISPSNEAYSYATASVFTSNIENSIDNPAARNTSSTNYDLRDVVAKHAIVTPIVFPIWEHGSISTSTIPIAETLASCNVSLTLQGVDNYNIASAIYAPDSTATWNSAQNVPFVANITQFNTCNVEAPLHTVTRSAAPKFTAATTQQVVHSNVQLTTREISLSNLVITSARQSQDGFHPNGTIKYVVVEPPKYGALSALQFDASGIQSLTYSPWRDAGLNHEKDSFVVQTYFAIQTSDGSNYGVYDANENIEVNILFSPSNTFHIIPNALVFGSNIRPGFSYTFSNELLGYPDEDFEVRILSIDPMMQVVLNVNGTRQEYSSNAIATMVNENIWDYPPGSIRTRLEQTVVRNLTIVDSCNLSTTNQSYSPILTDVQNNLYQVIALSPPSGQDALSNVIGMYDEVKVASLIPNQATSNAWTMASSNLNLWVQTYDSPNYVPYIQNAVNRDIEWHTAYFQSGFWESWSNTRILKGQYDATANYEDLASINFLSNATKRYDDEVVPLISLVSFAYPYASQVWPVFRDTYHKYYEVPRLFLTANDFEQSKVSLEVIESAPSNLGNLAPLEIGVGDTNRRYTVDIFHGSNNLWANVPIFDDVSYTLPYSNISSGISLPSLAIAENAWNIVIPPSHGKITHNTALASICNVSQLKYVPRDLWVASSVDEVEIVVADTSGRSAALCFNVSYDDTLRTASSPLLIPYLPRLEINSPITNEIVRNTVIIPFYASNELHIDRTYRDASQGTVTSMSEVSSVVINPYAPADGYLNIYSNIDTTFELTTLADSNNGTINVFSNITIVHDYFKETQPPIFTRTTLSNIAYSDAPITNVSNSNVTSNIQITQVIYTSTSNLFAKNSNITILDQLTLRTHYSNAHSPGQEMYVRTLSNIPQDPSIRMFIQPANSSSLYREYSYVTVMSNIHVYDAYVPITRNQISLKSPATVSLSPNVSGVVDVVEETVGPVTSLDIGSAHRYWARGLIPSCNIAFGVMRSNQALGAFNITTTPPVQSEIDLYSSVFSANILIDSNTSRGSIVDAIQNVATNAGLSFAPYYVHIRHVEAGSVVQGSNIITTITMANLNSAAYQSCARTPTDYLQVYFTDETNTNTSDIFRINLLLVESPLQYGQCWNLGLNHTKRTALCSNLFYHASNGIAPAALLVDISESPQQLNIYKNVPTNAVVSFTMLDVMQQRIHFTFDSTCHDRIKYNLFDTTADPNNPVPVGTDLTFDIRTFTHDSYYDPRRIVSEGHQIELQAIGHDRVEVQNVLRGDFWNRLEHLYLQDQAIPPRDVYLQLVRPLSHGFLWNEGSQVCSYTTNLQDIKAHALRYIPFDSNVFVNENSAGWQISVKNYVGVSPQYLMPWKNYVSRLVAPPINVATKDATNRTVSPPPRSAGLVTDGYVWEYNTATAVVPRDLTNLAPFTMQATLGPLWSGGLTFPRMSRTAYLALANTSCNLVIDQADSIQIPTFSASATGDIYDSFVYLVHAPEHGIVQHRTTGNVLGRWTTEEASLGNVLYQHLGDASSQNDSFVLAVASSPYTLTCNQILMNVQIRDMPTILSNRVDYAYLDVASNIDTEPFAFSTIALASGYLHVLDTSNVSKVQNQSGQEAQVLDVTLIQNCSYKFDSNILELGPDGRYPAASIVFAANNQGIIDTNGTPYVNRLSAYDEYRDLFIHNYDIRLNQHIDSNIILAKVDENQEISYTLDKDQTASSNLYDRSVGFTWQVQPRPSYDHPQNTIFDSTFFSFRILGDDVSPLFDFTVERTQWSLTTADHNTPIVRPLPSTLDNFAWNTIRIVNYDYEYEGNMSIYWKYSFTSVERDNLLRDNGLVIPPIDLRLAKKIEITTPVYDNRNLLRSCNVVIPIGDGMQSSFDFLNTHMAYYFRNFEITYNTYEVNQNDYNPDSHNLVVGKSLTVRGVNNICIGNTFSTAGQRSIIIGNNIGVVTDATDSLNTSIGVNDVYESIVIGNDSFRNSLVRDIICIGNENLNNLASLDVQQVQRFISYQPILIGNRLDSSMLDYHINVGNTFLKTNVQGEQIYLGLGNSPVVVGIGYSSNEGLEVGGNNTVLHINGNVSATRVTAATSQILKNIHTCYTSSDAIIPGNVVSEVPITSAEMAASSLIEVQLSPNYKDPLVYGIAVSSSTSNQVDVQVSGRARVWCSGAVAAGTLLVASSNAGVAIALPSSSDPERVAFARALNAWNPIDAANTPWVDTRTGQNSQLEGYIWCSLLKY